MKTLTVKFKIEYKGDIIESQEYEYEYDDEDKLDEFDEYHYEKALEQMENDKIAWVFNTISIRHEIISNK